MARARILVVDDEVQIRTMLRQLLERSGYDVADAPDGKVGMELQSEEPADLVVVDILMPSKDGIETIKELARDFPEVKIIAISGGGVLPQQEYLAMAEGLGAMCTLTKPIEGEELLEAIRELLK
jgi:DNA-binding response OmpR family regulator